MPKTLGRTLLLSLLLSLLQLGAPGLATAAPVTARSAARATTAHLTDTVLLGGAHVRVRGTTGTRVARPVRLQRLTGSTWRTVVTRTTTRTGTFALTDPTSEVGRYRVVAPALTRSGHHYVSRTMSAGTARWQDTLGTDQTLYAGYGLVSTDGAYTAVMQGDGNFVVYHDNTALWASGSGGTAANRVVMQGDGNLVIYDAAGKFYWSSSTAPSGGDRLVMQTDGNLVVYSRGDVPLWASRGGRTGWDQDTAPTGATLYAGQSITSLNGRFSAVMQHDGNFVTYDNDSGAATWASGSGGTAANRVVMQGDGNLVIYDASGKPYWSSSTAPSSNDRLVMQNDGNLVLYSCGGVALWASHGGRTGNAQNTLTTGQTLYAGQALWSPSRTYAAVMQTDGNFVVYHNGTATWASGTGGTAANRVVMQGDGNLVVYDASGKPYWSSNTAPSSGDQLVLQDDSNMVIYASSGPVWSINSNNGGSTGAGTGPSRSAVLTRAQSWVDAGVPYSQSRTYTNQYGTYRTDCSGFVSMAWQLGGPGYRTYTLPNVAHQISKDSLTAGDLLLAQHSHVVLFDHWANSSHSSYWGYEEVDGSQAKAVHRIIPYPYFGGDYYGTFLPYRINAAGN